MSSYDKIVKLACKPKAAPPKSKYIDPIIAATWSDDGAVSDVCKALVPRLREPNAVIVFKALIVLHTMIRNGATDNVLGYLSQADTLRLRNVTAANWEGYAAPENVQNYALYLDSRIRAYRDLKHDAIRVQSDTNRDVRNSISVDADTLKSKRQRLRDETPAFPTRSKTLVGRKLRSMTVEKGLLRETKIVHNMIDTLVECRFYLDDLEDELNIEALRMLVKDLLILFQAGNEGVINLLEHYFEMSHIDAGEALLLYRNFCQQTEKVVEYLGVAKKLQNLLNVPIPNLKHAPVSLAGALQEYLDDPNFDQNRIEYRANKKAAESTSKRPGNAQDGKNKKSPPVALNQPPLASASTLQSTSSSTNGTSSSGAPALDFFSAIEEEQQSMFPTKHSPPVIQQPIINPFSQMFTGQQFGQVPQISVQPTGFMVPQHTAIQASPAPNPFNNMLGVQQPQQHAPGHRPFSAFLPAQQTRFPQQTQQPQQTAFQQPQQPGFQQPQQTGLYQPQTGFLPAQQSNFLQPQITGANPFRQSMLVPQTTGMALFSNQSSKATNSPGHNMFAQPTSTPDSAPPFAPQPSNSASAFSSFGGMSSGSSPNVPNRPQSTPLTNNAPTIQAVKTHPTGTRNPFGPVITPAPPVPKPPTLMELSMGGSQTNGPGNNAPQHQSSLPNQTTSNPGFNFASSALNPGPTDISSVASSFTGIGNNNSKINNIATSPSNPLQPQHTATPFSQFSSSFSNQPSSTTTQSFAPSISVSAPLKSQATGLAGLKAFKPSSSFGAALLDSMPALAPSPSTPQSSSIQPQHTATPNSTFASFNSGSQAPKPPPGALNSPATSNGLNGSNTPFGNTNSSPTVNSQATGATGAFGMSGFNSAPTGSSLGVGLRPQLTGGGAANPFRASMLTPGSSLNANTPPVPSIPPMFTGLPLFAPTGAFSSPFNNQGQQQQQQQANAPQPSLF